MYEETCYGVCPYTDQRGNLVCIKVKWVLCYFIIVSRPVVYVDYSKTVKNILSDRSHLLLLTLKYTVALPGLVIFSNKAILWWLQVTSFNYQPGLHYSTERNGIFRGILWHYSPERNKLGLELGPLYWNVYSGSNIFCSPQGDQR